MNTGTRSDVPHHYIYPHSANTNLSILTGYHVKRVMFKFASFTISFIGLPLTISRQRRGGARRPVSS